MFTTLFNDVFPVLGRVFGQLVSIADMPFTELLNVFSNGGLIGYSNLFNGETGTIISFGLPNILADIIELISQLIPSAVRSLDTWACMLVCSTSIFFGVYLFKFLKDLIF